MSIQTLPSLGRKDLGREGLLGGVFYASLFALFCIIPQGIHAQEYGVFMRVAEAPDGTVQEVSAQVESAVARAGWTLLAAYDAGVNADDCSYQARVLVVDWPEHTRVVMAQGSHGAYAAPLRVSVFEDELGVHVSAVNPRSLNRTIVEEEGMDEEWGRLADGFRMTLANEIGVTPAEGEFGQFRKKGRIGRTMGVMAGGPFLEKLKHVTTVPAGEGGAAAIAQALFETLETGGPGEEWGVRPVYLMTPAPGVAVLGVTGERIESRSYSIVDKGSDKNRSDFACPGLDHSAAYPVEVVLTQEGEMVEIHMVDEMFRMKMFFEDAGKMKFARNMRMPGSIEDEIKNLIRAALF